MMADEKFQNKYRIVSARAQWHDYNGGVYFVTICTQYKKHYFGEILNGEMNFTEIGHYAEQCIQNIRPIGHFAGWDIAESPENKGDSDDSKLSEAK